MKKTSMFHSSTTLLFTFLFLVLVLGVAQAANSKANKSSDKSNHEKWMRGLAIKPAVDTNCAANTFETTLVAEATKVEINGTMVKVFAYNDQVPGPLIRVRQNDTVIVHFINKLDIAATIHWHGVSGNNAADGSQVTQHAVPPGGKFKYEFVAANAGVHWYHSHVKTAQTIFKGLYGALIVISREEEILQEEGILPEDDGTLVLGDISFDKNGDVQNVEAVNELGHMNGVEGETLLVNGKHNAQLPVKAGKPFMLRIINTSISRFWKLKLSTGSLIKVGGEGGLLNKTILSGGMKTAMDMPMEMIMCSGDEDCTNEYPICSMMGGMNHDDHHGGMDRDMESEMGEVDGDMVMDGPMTSEMKMGMCVKMAMADVGYESGEILLAPAMRATVVINTPEKVGNFTLKWQDYDRGTHSMEMSMTMCTHSMPMDHDPHGGHLRRRAVETMDERNMTNKDSGDMEMLVCSDPDYPQCMLMQIGGMRMCGRMIHDGVYDERKPVDVLTFHASASPQEAFVPFAEGTELLTHERVNAPLEDLGAMSVMPNVVWTGEDRINLKGFMNEDGTFFTIDDFQWPYGMGLSGGFPGEPESARKAKLGDIIEFEVHNDSEMDHPFHLHGFAFQPLYFMEMHHEAGWMRRYEYETTELMDTLNIPVHTSLFARVRLSDIVGDDRAKGRWLFHCHIAQHAERGMISELIVE